MSFNDCIDAAVDDQVIRKEDGDELKRRYAAERRAAGGDAAAAKANLASKLEAEGIEKRRRKLLAMQASTRIADDIRAYRGPDGQPDIVSAALRLYENVGHTGYESVRGRFNALFGGALSEMGDALHDFGRGALDPRRTNLLVLDDVARAAFGETADPKAKAFYDAWIGPNEKLRQLYNESGGTIGWRADWGLPMRHDAGAVLRVGFEHWRSFADKNLGWDRMAYPASGTRILPEDRTTVLNHVWKSIVMDGQNTREPSAVSAGRPSMANARNDPRFLVFKDADSWLAYNRQFGTGNVFDTMLGHTRSLSKDVAAMQILGPNPGATTQWLKQIIAQEGARFMAGEPTTFRPGWMGRLGSTVSDGSVPASIAKGARLVDSMFEMVRGSDMPRDVIDETFSAFKNWQTSAKLGSAITVHATTNPVLLATALAHYGLPVSRMAGDIVKSFAGHSAREIDKAGMIVTDAMHTLEQGAREAGALTRAVKWSEWLPHVTTKYSGLEGGVQALRRAWWWGASNGVTNVLDRDWQSLEPRMRDYLFKGFGLNEQDWRIMQSAKLYDPGRGAPFLRWQEIRDAGLDNHAAVGGIIGADTSTPEGTIAAAKASEGTAMRYLGMLHQAQEFAVPSSRWRSQVTMTGATQRGTMVNRVVQSAAMFKGFLGSATVSYFEALRHELAGRNATGGAAAGAIGIVLAAMGLVSLQMKTVASGKDLAPMDPTTPQGRATLAHAALTSGALGIYGDFLSSDQSSYGHDLLATAAGPIVTGVLDTGAAASSGVKGLFESMFGQKRQRGASADTTTEMAEAAIKMARNNTPVLSTHWALRAAYNRILLDQLQYLMDPKAHQTMRRTEERVAKETGQQFWWRPGATAPERWPRFTQGQ